MARGTWGGNTEYHPLNVRITYTLGSAKCVTGFKLRHSTILGTGDPQEAAEDVGAWVNESYRTLFTTADRFDGVDVVDMTNGEGGGYSFNNVTGTINAAASNIVPSYITAPISLKGELRRRYGQGRMLWPVRGEGFITEDKLDATGVAAFQGVIDNMIARYLGAGGSSDYTLVNVHGLIAERAATPTSPARAAVQPSWYDVTTVRLNTSLSFLRSRKQGVGS